jgi:hypothetical protein
MKLPRNNMVVDNVKHLADGDEVPISSQYLRADNKGNLYLSKSADLLGNVEMYENGNTLLYKKNNKLYVKIRKDKRVLVVDRLDLFFYYIKVEFGGYL